METSKPTMRCPLLFAGETSSGDSSFPKDWSDCQEGRCAWWVTMHTSERAGFQYSCCAIAAIALKNNQGQIAV